MKDNLFEMLLNLFETSLNQLQETHQSNDKESQEAHTDNESLPTEETLHLKTAKESSCRVFTYDEQMKLTKASYQFLMRMKLLGILRPELFESIVHQLQFSDSRIITLEETKWTIRNNLATNLNEDQLAFLDLVLYQSEDALTKH